MLNEDRLKVLNGISKKSTHKIKFYTRNQQFWFKNSTTGSETPLPIALLESVIESEDGSEPHQKAVLSLQRYVEGAHSACKPN